jgi:hypothetical protein
MKGFNATWQGGVPAPQAFNCLDSSWGFTSSSGFGWIMIGTEMGSHIQKNIKFNQC